MTGSNPYIGLFILPAYRQVHLLSATGVCSVIAAVLGWPCGAQPLNDNFRDAIVLGGNSAFVTGSNVDSSLEMSEPQVYETYSTVWYQWQAPYSCTVNVYTDGSSFDTVLAVFTGSSVTQLVCVADNDDEVSSTASTASLVEFNANEGVTYYIQVGGYGDASGDVMLSLICAGSWVTNDNFSQAGLVSGPSGRIYGSSVNATVELGEPGTVSGYGGHSIWYRWIAPYSGNWAFSTDMSGFDTVLGVYTGKTVSSLATLSFNDDQDVARKACRSRVRFGAISNQEYYILVDGYSRQSGAVVLNWGENPANDNFSAALPLLGDLGATNADNVGASRESLETITSGMHSIWYHWIAPSTGLWTFNTQPSDFDTRLAIYTGSTISNLNALESSDNVSGENYTSSVVVPVTNGVHYYVVVDGVVAVQSDGSVDYTVGNVGLNWFPLKPQITSAAMVTNAFNLSFWTAYGTNYVTEWKRTLADESWGAVTNCIGNGLLTQMVDHVAGATQRVYRVRIE